MSVRVKPPLKHLGIIMDGNRRWAKARGLPAVAGHRHGYLIFKKIADHCLARGIKILTIYAFSSENWRRSKKEVAFLMQLLKKGVEENLRDFIKKGIRIKFLGSRDRIPKSVLKTMDQAAARTAKNKGGILNVAINYGGRGELVRAFQKLAARGLKPQKITEQAVSKTLDTAGEPDPELIIRTSGEQRLSGFLTWQSVYSELYFSPKLWPDFTPADLDAALADFARRQRRFGGSQPARYPH